MSAHPRFNTRLNQSLNLRYKSKIFTGVLNNRLKNWVEDYNVLSDSQFGFRKGRSTTDACFVLNAAIQKILSEKGRLYCAFVDFKKHLTVLT